MKSLKNHLQYAADEKIIELSDSQNTIETEILSSQRRENDNYTLGSIQSLSLQAENVSFFNVTELDCSEELYSADKKIQELKLWRDKKNVSPSPLSRVSNDAAQIDDDDDDDDDDAEEESPESDYAEAEAPHSMSAFKNDLISVILSIVAPKCA